jgi:hypothetical protein
MPITVINEKPAEKLSQLNQSIQLLEKTLEHLEDPACRKMILNVRDKLNTEILTLQGRDKLCRLNQ